MNIETPDYEARDNHAEIAIHEANGAKVERSLPVLVTMRDRITNTFTVPRVSPTLLAAKRDFTTAVNNARPGESLLADHPEHFTLYHIGYWNDQTGQIVPIEREIIVSGDDVRLTDEQKSFMFEKARVDSL